MTINEIVKKGIINLKEKNIDTSYFYEERKLTHIQFHKEKEWRLKFAIETLEF